MHTNFVTFLHLVLEEIWAWSDNANDDNRSGFAVHMTFGTSGRAEKIAEIWVAVGVLVVEPPVIPFVICTLLSLISVKSNFSMISLE